MSIDDALLERHTNGNGHVVPAIDLLRPARIERLTLRLLDAIGEDHTRPDLCMIMRGVEKQGAVTTTSAMLGEFQADPFIRQEFMDSIARRSSLGS